jgi:hypothetical protein
MVPYLLTVMASFVFSDLLSSNGIGSIYTMLLGIPVGLLVCFFTYRHLKKKWAKDYIDPASIIDEIGSDSE